MIILPSRRNRNCDNCNRHINIWQLVVCYCNARVCLQCEVNKRQDESITPPPTKNSRYRSRQVWPFLKDARWQDCHRYKAGSIASNISASNSAKVIEGTVGGGDSEME